MWTMKMGEEGSSLITKPLEINCKHASTRFQNPSNFIRALQSSFTGQMVNHYAAQNSIELTVAKWERLGQATPKEDFDASLIRLLLRPGKHLGRGVEPVYDAAGANALFGCNGQSSCSTAYIQDAFTSGNARKGKHLVTKRV